MKNFIWIGGIIIILIALMFWGVKGTSGINPPFESGVIHPLDHVEGNASSSVVIVEYSDFQCPACRTYYGVVKQLVVEFGGEAAFVYRYFPLTGIHINAEFAAQAAEAAGKQGKFWEMHDLLFEKQEEWANVADIEPLFESYAALLDISVEQFKTDFMSKEVRDFVRAERTSALKLGLQGTPSFFINGKQIQNPSSTEAFRTIIKDAIGSQR
ncbi:MAG: thioredoxin domain-containing protein [Candidatus Zambryskibacteria bacterium]